MTPSLSDTFEPPSTTTYGRVGVVGRLAQRRDLLEDELADGVRQHAARRRRPTPACGARRRSRRRRTTSASAARSAASAARSASSLDVSRGSNRMFSSRAISPSCSAATVALAESPTTSCRERDGLAEQLAEAGRDGRERVLVLRRTLRAAEVGGDDDACAGGEQRLQRRQGGADAAVVGDGRAVERHVEVGADEHALAAQVAEVLDGLHASSSLDWSRAGHGSVRVRRGRWPGRTRTHDRHYRCDGTVRDARRRTSVSATRLFE